jgi:cytochrome c-type biogenesis protein CcmF
MIRWIWFGALMIGLGGLTTALDRRYRRGRSRTVPQETLGLAT